MKKSVCVTVSFDSRHYTRPTEAEGKYNYAVIKELREWAYHLHNQGRGSKAPPEISETNHETYDDVTTQCVDEDIWNDFSNDSTNKEWLKEYDYAIEIKEPELFKGVKQNLNEQQFRDVCASMNGRYTQEEGYLEADFGPEIGDDRAVNTKMWCTLGKDDEIQQHSRDKFTIFYAPSRQAMTLQSAVFESGALEIDNPEFKIMKEYGQPKLCFRDRYTKGMPLCVENRFEKPRLGQTMAFYFDDKRYRDE